MQGASKRLRIRVSSTVAVAAFILGCSGGKQAKSGADVKCPPGQTFDGSYCRVDQTVATVETPVPAAVDSSPSQTAQQPSGDEVPEQTATEELDAVEEGSSGEQDLTDESPVAESPVEGAPALATPVDYAMAAQAAPVMQYLARSHLPNGARALAPPFAGQFAEGQILEQKFQLISGKCYTVVGLALPPIAELDIELFAESDQKTPLARDDTTGPQAVLGSRDKCYLAEVGGPARLVLRVRKGQGVAAAQVYSK